MRDPACDEASKQPPCVRNCRGGARIYGDLDSPTDPAGKLVAEGKAKPLPYLTDKPRAYFLGRVPADVENQLPKPSKALPRRYIPLTLVPY